MTKTTKKQRGIFKRDGLWWIRYADQYGKEHREKVGIKSRALEIYQQRKTEIRLGRFESQDIVRKYQNVTVAEIVNDYLETRGQTHKSVKDTRSRLLWWSDFFKDQAAKSITPGDIEKARAVLLRGKLPCNNGKRILPGEHRTPSTVNRYLAAFKAAFSMAVKNEKVIRNPVKLVKLQNENEFQRNRYLTNDEEERLFKVVPREHHPLLVVALNTGLRKTEQLSLTWNDIDFRQGLIRVKKSKSGKVRFVPMRKVVIQTLKALPRMIDNPFVFCGQSKGTRRSNLPEEWEAWLKKAKIEDFRWHDLRHTFASRLVSAGCSLYVVQEYLGHSIIAMTERYAHLAKDYLKRSIELPDLDTAPEFEPAPEPALAREDSS